ncbi:hypothetical protein POM88_002693, partial [Heracleum sosnowskyi]
MQAYRKLTQFTIVTKARGSKTWTKHKFRLEYKDGLGFDDEDNLGPFDILRTKSASVDRLKRWRQAALVLNTSRRFRYTLDLKKEEEKKQIIAKIRTHAQVIRAHHQPLQNYMEIQKEVTPHMRGILVNWLIEISRVKNLPPGKDNNTMRTVIISVVGISGVAMLLLVLYCIFKRKTKHRITTGRLQQGTVEDISSVESLHTVEFATNNFSDSNKLGQGGFGAVYKGTFKNGQEVAVKRLSRGSGQEGTERLLIYEFVPNASLDHVIFDLISISGESYTRGQMLRMVSSTSFSIFHIA